MDEFQKDMMVKESGKDLKFISRKTEEYERNPTTGELVKIDPNAIRNQAYLPVTTLKLTFDVFQGSSTDERDVYESFEWLKGPGAGNLAGNWGISRDSIGIAVDQGWTIESGKYSCGVQYNSYNPNTNSYLGWIDATSTWAPNPTTKTPSDINLYGASWSFTKAPNGNYNINDLWKGTVKLSMIKTNTNSVGRVVGRYAQSVPSPTGNFGLSIGWGPATISYSATSGSINTHDIDLTWSSLPAHNEG